MPKDLLLESVKWLRAKPTIESLFDCAALCLMRNRNAVDADSALPERDMLALGEFVSHVLRDVDLLRELVDGNVACGVTDAEQLGWWLTEAGVKAAESE